jgi:hypothetical protein
MLRLHSTVKSGFQFTGYTLALCGLVFQGCGSEEKRVTKDASESLTLEWKATPTIDASCKLTIPALATFVEYAEEVTKTEKPFNSKKKSESLLKSKFDSATAKLTLESSKEICESIPAATEEGMSCSLKTLPPPQDASESEWLPTQNLVSSWTVKGKEPAAEKTLTRKLKLEISKFKSLTIIEPVNPPTLAANISAGMQAGCTETGCLPGSRASVATGFFHSCAVSADGGASCWGYNSSGQLGNGTTTDSKFAVVVSSLSNVTQISAGSSHTCALISDGTVKCWGSNSSGQSASGSISTNNSSPVAVSGLTGVAAIGAGSSHTCVLITDGTVKCWGANTNRQIVDTSQVNYTTPTDVTGVTGAVALAVGGSHTCALISDGTVKCWGYNYYTPS